MEKILVLCAHPDDETLGLGGSLALHSQKKDDVFLLCFASGQFGRDESKNGIKIRENQAKKACKILGIKNYKFLGYPDEKLDSVPLLDLIKQTELIIKKFKPTIMYTHFWGDVNQDHRRVFEASLIASRATPYSKIKKLICYETPSSTEWGQEKFIPNLFINIEDVLDKKLKAINEYKSELHPYPHPRSKTAVKYRAGYWGSLVGVPFAESFMIFREIYNK